MWSFEFSWNYMPDDPITLWCIKLSIWFLYLVIILFYIHYNIVSLCRLAQYSNI